MFEIKTMNSISPMGVEVLEKHGCRVGADVEKPQALLIRSAELHGYPFNEELLCIARAGAGTNNIPVEDCAEKGIVVFNSPGANAEAVKELEMCSLVLASRDVLGSIAWVKTIAGEGEKIPKLVEKGKNSFGGPELMGKTMGVIGLGATGALVANLAVSLEMTVYGYDPFMSVDAAWNLSREVIRAESLDDLLSKSDYISLNVPYTEETHHMLNKDLFARMKDGVRIINESRGEVVCDEDMLAAIDSGKVARYVTDFPNELVIGKKNVIVMPHLGACTPESEDRCAVMGANQIWDYLANGNIKNSVNLCRLCVIHRNVPRMITRILDSISAREINVEHMINKPRGGYAVTIIDLGTQVGDDVADNIRAMPEVLRVRVI